MSSSTGTILVTGGFGKTSSQVAQALHSRGHSALVGSRQGQAGVPAPHKGVQFDWVDKASWSNPFTADANISGVYIVAPPIPDPYPVLKEFVKFAQEKGTKRFVYLGAAQFPAPSLAEGYADFTRWLAASGLEWAALKPTWFQENLGAFFLGTIRDQDAIPSATGDGDVAFISTHDIASVAVDALTAEKSHNKEHSLVGPELLSYDKAAELLSAVLGRKITHNKLTREGGVKSWVERGAPEPYAIGLTEMELDLSRGFDKEQFARPDVVKGKVTLKEYIEANKELWGKN